MKLHDVLTAWTGSRWVISCPYPGCCQTSLWLWPGSTKRILKQRCYFLKSSSSNELWWVNCCLLSWLYPDWVPELFIWLCLHGLASSRKSQRGSLSFCFLLYFLSSHISFFFSFFYFYQLHFQNRVQWNGAYAAFTDCVLLRKKIKRHSAFLMVKKIVHVCIL